MTFDVNGARQSDESNTAFLNLISQDLRNLSASDEIIQTISTRVQEFLHHVAERDAFLLELNDALRDSSERLRVTIENLPGGAVFVVDRDLRYLLAEGEALTPAGFKPQDLVGKTIFEVLAPELTAGYEVLYRQALGGEPFVHEHNVHGLWYLTRGTPLRLSSGETYAVLAVSYDISDRKRREQRQDFLLRLNEALRSLSDPAEIQGEATRLLREQLDVGWCYYNEFDETGTIATVLRDSVKEGLPSMVGVHDLSDVPEFTNFVRTGSVFNTPDISTSELFNQRVVERYTAIGMWSALGAPLVKNGQLIAVLLLADTSPRKWSDEEIALLKEVAERLWATTERAHVEAVLRESEAKYRSLFTSMNDGFCIVELIYNEQQQPIDYLFLEANAAFEQQAGLSQPIGKTGLYFAPNHEPEILANYHQVAVTGKPIEFEITMADLGRSFRASTNRHGDPHKRQVAIVFNDITERKCREASQALLAEVTERLAGLSDIDETMEQLGETIGGHFGVKYCMFAEHTDEFETAIAYGWNDADVPAIGGTYRMRDFLADAELAAILTGKPLIVSDTQTDARVSAESYGALNIHSFIIVPLLRDRQWQFQISIIDNKPRTWRDDEVELMRELTRRIWASLERARAEAATIADLHDTQLLRELATRLVIEGDIQTLYQEIISTAIALTHADAGTVQILDNKTQDLLLLATQGLDRTLIEQNARVDASSISPCGIALRNGERSFVDFDVPDEDPDGSMRMYVEAGYLSAQSTPLISRSGRAIGMVSTHWRKQRRPSDRELRFLDLLARQAADLIEQRQFEQALRLSESRFRLIMESAKDYAIFTLNLNGVVTSWNAGAENLLGYTESEIIGRNGRIIFTPEDIEQGKPAREMQLAQTQGRAENERWHVRQDGSSFWGSGLMMPLQDETGTMQGFVKIMQDKTAERQSAAEREQLLQQEQIARAEADRANSIKDQFLAVLSHELRTPLNPILGWTRLLQTGRLPEARQREALERIERNAKLQIQLIEDLLDISRIMRGKLSLTVADVSLTSVITSAVETVRLAADAKQIQILLDLPTEIAPVSGDEARLQQVVWNLLSNAVKFTPNGGRVIVELRQLEGLAQIRVIDTGKGIDPEFLPYVFEYFRQEDSSTTRKFGGLGLGLAIVRQIVEMHGGTVGVESLGEDRGATFIVELPVIRQAAATGFQPSQSPVENLEECLNNLQILLVDDEVDTLEYQAFLLEESGAKVVAVASSSEALQELERFIPDVLISDIGMAEMDGYMLIQEIRDRPPEQGGTIPAIAVTAYAQDFDRQTAFESGFQAHITKPVEPEELIKTILKVNAS